MTDPLFTPADLNLLQAALTTPTCWNPNVRGEALKLVEREFDRQQSLFAEAVT